MSESESDRTLRERVRAQVGIGTLIVFIAMVLVAAIAAGVLINTAGFLQSKSEATGQQSGEQVTNRLQVLQTSGVKTERDSPPNRAVLGGVEMVVTKAPGADDIALTGLTMQWVDDSGTYDLVHEDEFPYNPDGSTPLDGAFAHETIKDEDSSLSGTGAPVLNSADDRARLVVDVGRNDVVVDNRIGKAYDNHTYNENDFEGVEEDSIGIDLVPQVRDSSYDGTFLEEDLGGGSTGPTPYAAGTVIRATQPKGSKGLPEGGSASIRITTASGTASTVQLVVPESLSGRTAVRL